YGGPAPHVAPSDRQSSLRTKSVLGEISIAPSAPQRPAFVQPSLCGGFAPHKLLIRCARLTQHKSGPRLANLTHAGVCHGSATLFRQRRRLASSRRAVR